MKKIVFSILLVAMLLSVSSLFINAESSESEPTMVVSMTDGAQIRTDNLNGLRWQATVENPVEGATYGFILGKGVYSSDEFIVDNLNEETMKVVELDSLTEDNKFSVTMINFPERGYAQDISVRAFAVVNDTHIYSEEVVVRNLAEVALEYAKKGNTHDFSSTVIEHVKTNYMSTSVGFDGTINVGSPIYETNPGNLAVEFVADWNTKFGTTWTKFSGTSFSASAADGTSPLTENASTDPTGTNAYEFFVKDEQTSAKWQWLLKYFEEIGTAVHPTRQVKSILTGSYYEDGYTVGLFKFSHLGCSLENFFYNTQSAHNTNTNYMRFSESSNYAKVSEFNNVIYALSPELVQIGTDYELILGDKSGYNFTGYLNGESLVNDFYTITPDVVSLIPQFEAISYSIKYMNDSEELTDLAATYTVEDEVTLPSLEIEYYDFHGWYENPEFDGEPITKISVGTIGEKVYYAKLTSSVYANVNVTFDANGGKLLPNNVNIPAVKEFEVSKYINNGSTPTYMLDTGTGNTLRWQYKILLKYNSTYNAYEVVATDAAKSTLADLGVEWTHALADSATDISTYAAVGQYIYLDVEALQDGTAQTAKVYNESDFSSYTTVIKDPGTLPRPSKDGAAFVGWKSSLDSNIITEYPGYNENPGDITYTAQWSYEQEVDVTFDYDGGATKELYLSNGTILSSLIVNTYNNNNGNYWDSTTTPYKNYIFASTSGYDPKAKFSTRIYLGVDAATGYYKVMSIINSGNASAWAADASLVITIADQYAGTGNSGFDVSKISVGDVVFMSGSISSAATTPVTLSFYDDVITNDVVTETVDGDFTLPTPVKAGYSFAGWYDANGNKYTSASSFISAGSIKVTAKWSFEDKIIGEFVDNSWVVVGEDVQLSATLLTNSSRKLAWKSSTPAIATVDDTGVVKGVSEGLATIIVTDAEFTNISFTFYVTVVASDSGIVGLLLDSNNASIFTRDDLGIGAGTPAYYYDVVGSVSKLLFTPYKEYTTYYLSSPSNKSTLTGSGTGGVDFITFHYAADMPYSANYSLKGGSNLASYNKSCNTNGTGASWHYSTGNDGIWYCQNVNYGAWHAGTSKTMKWYASGVTTSQVGSDIYTTDVTCKSDNYFYIKGVKTNVTNSTGYSYTKLNAMGLAVKLVGNEWYIGGCYYNSSYKYISSLGGNNNSIGIESSVREGSDLWLTWQYSAQLCAKLLDQFNLPLNRLVGHHFFSGKDCPQPLLENDLEIWYEFVEMTRQEMSLRQNYSGYTISCSSNSSYVNSYGRVKSLPTYTQCVTYTVTYTTGSTSKTITLSTILPGTVA